MKFFGSLGVEYIPKQQQAQLKRFNPTVLKIYPQGESESSVNLYNPPSFEAQDFKMTFLTALHEMDISIKCTFAVPLKDTFKIPDNNNIMKSLIKGDLLQAI